MTSGALDIDVVGMWWLPGREDRKLPGTLTFSPDRGGRLKLIDGALMDPIEIAKPTIVDDNIMIPISTDDIEKAGTYERIYGLAEDKPYTLEDATAFDSSGPLYPGRNYYQVIDVTYIYRGAHFADGVAPTADRVWVHPAGLETWVGWSGASGSVKLGRRPVAVPYKISVRERAPESVAIDGGELVLLHHVNLPKVGVDGAKIDQRFSWSLRSTAVAPVDDLIGVVSDLQDLISIGTGRTASFDTLSFRHPDFYSPVPKSRRQQLKKQYPDGKSYTDITLWARWSATEPDPLAAPLHVGDLYFGFDDLGGLEGVARWLAAVRPYRSSLARVMATRYQRGGYLHDGYFSRVAALEGLDTLRHGDDVIYRKRLRRCADLAGAPFADLVGDVDVWTNKIKNDRNDMAHHKGVRLDKDLSEQHWLSEASYWLYVLCLLRIAAAPDAVFDRIAGHHQYQSLKRHLASCPP